MIHKRVINKTIGALLLATLMLTACGNNTSTAEPDTTIPATVKIDTLSSKATTEIVMYKSPGCECCSKWADHLKSSGFSVMEHKRDDMDAIKTKYAVTKKLASCHTAIVGGYVIEGHVPAADVERLLKQRPANVIGLSAPGMPMKSPGMQSAGQAPKGYDVLAFDKDGKTHVFTHY